MQPDNASKAKAWSDAQGHVSTFVNSFLEDPRGHLPCSPILEYKTGQPIYGLDQPAPGLYLVIDGRVTVCRSENNGRPVVVDIYQEGEFFGESALLRIPRAQEQAIALENTRVMMWSTAQIETVVLLRPQLAVALLQVLALRLVDFKSRLHSLASEPAPRRLVHTLIRFAERLGQTNKDGSVQMIPFTHKLLAQYVGTSREVITLFMNRFRRAGYLNYSRGGYILIHRDALAEWLRESPAAQPCESQTIAMAG
ncbi:MAG TPA: Crp/Fnr family transcriptional regulator [Bryobacteraceae bacterium]|nr:Crp/Fnr family transcriptional regulator [Bryobacteraceae bacterium]HXJ43036.1 Crp/Fnr family transcriptional regulator [Bryobacteraceae bacterium]